MRKLDATRFEMQWDEPKLPNGYSIQYYWVLYRLRNSGQDWLKSPIINGSSPFVLDLTKSGLPEGNYEFCMITRFKDDSGKGRTSGNTCPIVKGYQRVNIYRGFLEE